ncbi:MAG: hypothetical protein JW951_07690 [Lentisphaerae bacterium]|nr:hypothetical protein [Lentisphaerota bacterium]
MPGQPDPLLAFKAPSGWSVGARWDTGARDFDAESRDLDVDLSHWIAWAGYTPLPWLGLYVEAGSSRAELIEEKGERGLAAGLGARFTLAEYVIRRSPVSGRRQFVSFGGDGFYRYRESNFDNADFDWTEFGVVPEFVYTVYDPAAHKHRPKGMRLRGGLIFADADGRYGGEDVEAERNFGFRAGFDMLGESGWLGAVTAELYGSGDNVVSLGVGYYF